MRVNSNDIKAIKDVAKAVFGDTVTIRLFGSRTDDQKRGGDIDLLIQCNHTISRMELYQLKIRFLVQLKNIIGDQKIAAKRCRWFIPLWRNCLPLDGLSASGGQIRTGRFFSPQAGKSARGFYTEMIVYLQQK